MNHNTTKAKIQPRDKLKLHPASPVKLTRQGERFAEVLYMAKQPCQGAVKLSKKDYMVISTGEVKQYQQHEKKQWESLAKTFAALRGIIRANFEGNAKNQRSITLTYREMMTDPEKLMEDFRNFWKYFCLDYKGHKLEYVVVAEPQERGSWHLHVMVKSDQPSWWVDMDKLNKRWRHGWTGLEALKSDDVGQYYVTYFTSLADETKAVQGEVSEEMSKSKIKGGRLHFYPKGMRFYRCSRGIVRPKAEDVAYGEVLCDYGEPTYINTYAVVTDDGAGERDVNVIQKQTHIRKKRRE